MLECPFVHMCLYVGAAKGDINSSAARFDSACSNNIPSRFAGALVATLDLHNLALLFSKKRLRVVLAPPMVVSTVSLRVCVTFVYQNLLCTFC